MAIKLITGKCFIEKILSQILIYYALNKPHFAQQTARNKQTNKKQNPQDQRNIIQSMFIKMSSVIILASGI